MVCKLYLQKVVKKIKSQAFSDRTVRKPEVNYINPEVIRK